MKETCPEAEASPQEDSEQITANKMANLNTNIPPSIVSTTPAASSQPEDLSPKSTSSGKSVKIKRFQFPGAASEANEESPSSSANPQSPATPHVARSPEDFTLLRVIGQGSYGKVMLVKDKHDDNVYAMKMLRKEDIIKRNQIEHTRTERNVMQFVQHPFIVQLYYAFQTPRKLYLVMDFCPGGELFYHLSRAQRFTANRARFYSAQLILALEYLHTQNIVYRDLKPENVLIDADGYVRLTDFGLSKEGVLDNYSARSLCGTPEYLAPEILNQTGHGKAVDWWSLGALIYEMLTGLPPFYSQDREVLFDSIRHAELTYPSFVPPIAKSLLQSLFQRDPDKRLGGSAEEIKNHPFYQSVDWDALYNRRIVAPFKPLTTSPTDVQNFDREFLRLPVVNSETDKSILAAQAEEAREEEENVFQDFTYDPNAQRGELG